MIEIGTRVKNKENGQEGAVICPLPGQCQNGEVLIEYDRIAGSWAVHKEKLEDLGKIQVEVSQSCRDRDCAFLRPEGNQCVRWTSQRWGFLFGRSIEITKTIPLRIYPHCQNEAV